MSELTKWPRLIVVGDPVTREQANDILIRTNQWAFFSTNDTGWEHAVEAAAAECLGRPIEPNPAPDVDSERRIAMMRAHWQRLRDWRERVGVLNLHYLENAQVMSSWMGGPHGWCDWDGRIGCSNYNIGKWPSKDDITEDLTAIAAAWPFLRMHVQVVANEGEGDLLATWAVQDGKAAPVEPIGLIDQPNDDVEAMALGFLNPHRERGVSLDRLREALCQVRDQPGGGHG